jgi:hypothetical protein
MQMLMYIGTKVVNAMPMTRLEYNNFRNWILPADEDGSDRGYLVEYVDGGKPNTEAYSGYVSWSPVESFNKAYRPLTALTFGQALEALKMGSKIARAGWNGKDMWLSLSCNGTREVYADQFWSPHNEKFAEGNGGTATVLPCITMKTADNKILMGWLASQTDLLSDDWCIVV